MHNVSGFSLKKCQNQANKNGILIPFENGVLNIKTLEFYNHNPEFYNTHVLSISYDKNAKIEGTPFEFFF